MRTQLDGLERHGELVDGEDRYSRSVREELLLMSAASIDRYLKSVRNNAHTHILRSAPGAGAEEVEPDPVARTPDL